MPVYTDGVGNYFIGTVDAGVTKNELQNGQNNGGLLASIRIASGIRSASRISIDYPSIGNNELCFSFTAPLGVGGEVNVSAINYDGVTPLTCDGAIGDNVRLAVMLWTSNVSRKPASINSGNTNSQEVTVDISSAVDISSTWAIANNVNARFWMTVSQQRYITFFCFVDQNNYYSIEMGYTNEVSGVVFPLNCIVKYNIMYQGVESWYAGVPTSVGLTNVTAIPQSGGRANYSHIMSTYGSKDATNLYAVTSTSGIGRCGTNLKITRVPSLYSSLAIRSKFQTDSDVLGSPKRNYIVMGKSGVNDSSLVFLCHCNGNGNVTASNIINEVTPAASWNILGSPTFSITQSKFGSRSVQCATSTDKIQLTSNLAPLSFFQSNFTVEFWIRWEVITAGTFMVNFNNSFPKYIWQIYYNGSSEFQFSGGSSSTSFSGFTPNLNTWYHLAFCRSSTVLRFFVNGVQTGGNQTAFDTPSASSTFFTILQGLTSGNVQMDEIAIWTSAKYTANFTPPTTPYAVLPELIAMQTY